MTPEIVKLINAELETLTKTGDMLVRLKEVINWQVFSPVLKKAFKQDDLHTTGRKPYCRMMMFKVLILQTLYNLSDHQTEFQIRDRLSFMRFLDLTLESPKPDEKTIWAYREVLVKGNYIDELFDCFEKQLIEKGYAAKSGSILDASIIAAPKQRNSKDDNEKIKKNEPTSFEEKPNVFRQKDVDARWAKKGNETHYGYKDHIAADAGYKLIRSYKVTPANVSDGSCFKALLGDELPAGWHVWADSAYFTAEDLNYLARKNLSAHIISRNYRKLTPWSDLARENTRYSKIRVRVEHVFGFLKNTMRTTLVRTVGLVRAKAKIGLANLTYNLCRFEQLERLHQV